MKLLNYNGVGKSKSYNVPPKFRAICLTTVYTSLDFISLNINDINQSKILWLSLIIDQLPHLRGTALYKCRIIRWFQQDTITPSISRPVPPKGWCIHSCLGGFQLSKFPLIVLQLEGNCTMLDSKVATNVQHSDWNHLDKHIKGSSISWSTWALPGVSFLTAMSFWLPSFNSEQLHCLEATFRLGCCPSAIPTHKPVRLWLNDEPNVSEAMQGLWVDVFPITRWNPNCRYEPQNGSKWWNFKNKGGKCLYSPVRKKYVLVRIPVRLFTPLIRISTPLVRVGFSVRVRYVLFPYKIRIWGLFAKYPKKMQKIGPFM